MCIYFNLGQVHRAHRAGGAQGDAHLLNPAGARLAGRPTELGKCSGGAPCDNRPLPGLPPHHCVAEMG